MDKPLSRAIKKVQQKKKLSEVNQTMMDVAKGAQTLATVAMKAAKGEKGGAEADRMRRTHMIATKRTMTASYNFGIDEAAPLTALAKGAIMVSKAAAKAGAKAGTTVAKGGAKVAKGAAKAAKPASKPVRFKRPNIRSYKNKETGQVDMDRYRSDQVKYKQIKKDQAKYGDARDRLDKMGPDGVSDDRTKRGERKLKAIDKVTDKKKEGIKKGLETTGDVAKKTGEVAKSAGRKAKGAVSTTSKAFGTSSFAKEGITFKDYLNKL